MFPNYVFYLLYFFNLWGLCTEPSELRTSGWRHNRWTVLIFGTHFIYLCVLCGYIWHVLDAVYETFDLLNVTNHIVIVFAGAIIAHLIVIIESYCQRDIQRKFWTMFSKIRADFSRSDCDVLLGSYFVKFGQYFIAVIFIQFRQFLKWGVDEMNIYFIMSLASLQAMQQIRTFHYLFFVHLLSHQLSEVEMEMKLLADASENEAIARDRFRRIRMYYDLVHELSNCINEVFGWSNVTSILYSFLLLAADLNFCFWYYQIHFEYDNIAEDVLMIIHVVLLIVYVFNASTNCTIKYQNIIYHMNRIKVDLDDEEALVQVECTSLQFMRQAIVLHAKGFFVIDYNTLMKLLGGITTYMIFYIQFAPKFHQGKSEK